MTAVHDLVVSRGRLLGPLPQSEAAFLRVLREHALLSVDLRDRGPVAGLTPGELEDLTRTSRASISNLLKHFEPLLERQDADGVPLAKGTKGLARRYALKANLGLVASVDVAHAKVSIALSDLYGRILLTRTPQLGASDAVDPFQAKPTLDWAARNIKDALRELDRDPSDVVGVGLSLGAPVDRDAGLVRAALSLRSKDTESPWSNWQLTRAREQLRRRLGWDNVPYLLDNDANLTALAELTWGAARPPRFGPRKSYDNVVYVEWSQGVGAGLIIRGEIFRGAGVAGEIGHTVVPDGRDCSLCGNIGCLETIAGMDAIAAAAKAPDFETALREARDGKEQAINALDRAASDVAQVLGPVIHTLNPDLVLIGGEIGRKAYDLVEATLLANLKRFTMPPALKDVEVVSAALEDEAALHGAIGLVLRQQNGDPDALLEFLQRKLEFLQRKTTASSASNSPRLED